MSKEREIKCEYPQWKAERELKAQVAAARREAELYKDRFKAAKVIIVIAAALIIVLAIVAVANNRESTAADATEAVLTKYEKVFEAETKTAERIKVAKEVEGIFAGVALEELPEKNAEFLRTCRAIAKHLEANKDGAVFVEAEDASKNKSQYE